MISSHPAPILKWILKEARKLNDEGRSCVGVFDLDSTLFDVSPRIQRVLFEFSQSPEIRNHHPELSRELSVLKVFQSDWGIRSALARSGLLVELPEVQNLARVFWRQKFFSNEYLVHDIPYPGAVHFVQALYHTGCSIVYLTGRDAPRMGEGTLEGLRRWGFPIETARSQLILKPKAGLDDRQFKSDQFVQFKPFDRVWFFENEPANLRFVRASHPEVLGVFIESTHSGQEPPPVDLPRLTHFLLEEDS